MRSRLLILMCLNHLPQRSVANVGVLVPRAPQEGAFSRLLARRIRFCSNFRKQRGCRCKVVSS